MSNNLSELREEALKRARYKCEWAYCTDTNWLELAHILGIGMGGRDKASKYDINNVAMLCKRHHDIYDGKTISGAKRDYRDLLMGYLKRERS
jgi:predicted restriction endonuclease